MRVPLVLIAAVARNGAIGHRDAIPWRLPGDLRHFRAQTMGKPLILGRRTWQSIGRPLPGRSLVIVSRDPRLPVPEDAALCPDVPTAVARAKAIAAARGAAEVMVGGGAALYATLIAQADRLEITEVDLAPEADAFFPAIDPGAWQETARRRPSPLAGDEAAYALVTYRRRSSDRVLKTEGHHPGAEPA